MKSGKCQIKINCHIELVCKVRNSPDIFQEKMNKLLYGLHYVITFIDDLLIINTKFLEEHTKKLEKILSKLKSAGFKVHAKKSFFAKNELEYLGFNIIRKYIIPLPYKSYKEHSCP